MFWSKKKFTGAQASASDATKETFEKISEVGERPEIKGKESQTSTAAAHYRSNPSADDNSTIRFYDMSEYYVCLGRDAVFIVSNYDTMASMKRVSDYEAVTLNHKFFHKAVKDILYRQKRSVEVYTCSGRAKLEKAASPGDVSDFEDIFDADDSMDNSPVLMAAFLTTSDNGKHKDVGVAAVNTTFRRISFCQFSDNDQFSNLEHSMLQFGASECVFADMGKSNDADAKMMRDAAQRCNVAISDTKKSEFNAKDITQDLGKLMNGRILTDEELSKQNALACIQVLIKKLGLIEYADQESYTLVELKVESFMKLDAAAVKALNLLPTPQDSHKTMHLLGVLNKCKTSMGSRKIHETIRQPPLDLAVIERRLDVVQAFVEDITLRQQLQTAFLKNVPDLDKTIRRIHRSNASLSELFRLKEFVAKLPELAQLFYSNTGRFGDVLREKYGVVLYSPDLEGVEEDDQPPCIFRDLKGFHDMISLSVEEQGQYGDCRIIPSFDEKLAELAEQVSDLTNQMEKERQKVRKSSGIDDAKLKLEKNEKNGWFLSAPAKEESALRAVSGVRIVAGSPKAQVHATTDVLQRLEPQMDEAQSEYKTQQEELVKKILDIAVTYIPSLQELSDIIADLDMLLSFATVSASSSYTRPTMLPMHVPEGSATPRQIILKKARHPCLELQDGVNYIANDVFLHHDKARFMIITGGNGGGKSTFSRALGVVTLMAHMGCFVPCEEATISICDSILARVGASDSQARGVSTFMAEMLETSTILKTATEHSLILVDELGRGTSTWDGFGLAWAISEHLANEVRCFCLFATHFHELTSLQDTAPYVSNVHVATMAEGDQLTMLYQIKEGPANRSFGIECAELAKFPPSVIEAARRKVQELESGGDSPVPAAASSSGDDFVMVDAQYTEATAVGEDFMVVDGESRPTKDLEAEAYEVIHDFLMAVRDCPLSESAGYVKTEFNKIRQGIHEQAERNPVLKGLLESLQQ